MKIILADGTEVACGWAGASEGCLWVAAENTTLPEVAVLLGDVERTREIRAVWSESNHMEEVFTGYTRLFNIHVEEGLVLAGLRKESPWER